MGVASHTMGIMSSGKFFTNELLVSGDLDRLPVMNGIDMMERYGSAIIQSDFPFVFVGWISVCEYRCRPVDILNPR